jgi:hypothetical protein
VVQYLASGPVRVTGDLADLMPAFPTVPAAESPAPDPDEAAEQSARLADVAVRMAGLVMQDLGRATSSGPSRSPQQKDQRRDQKRRRRAAKSDGQAEARRARRRARRAARSGTS